MKIQFLYSEEFTNQHVIEIKSSHSIDARMGSLIILYLVLLYIVFAYRNHAGVQSRSPLLIMIGGIGKLHFIVTCLALMIDSMFNFMIQISEDNMCQCFIGIFTTVTNHYIAWLSIFLRAYRIGRFFDIYEQYLDNSEKIQMQSSQIRLTMPGTN